MWKQFWALALLSRDLGKRSPRWPQFPQMYRERAGGGTLSGSLSAFLPGEVRSPTPPTPGALLLQPQQDRPLFQLPSLPGR